MKVTVHISDVAKFSALMPFAIERATRDVVHLIYGNVYARTPIWQGGLRAGLHEEFRPLSGRVYFDDNVVAHVMEEGGHWTKKPPWTPIYNWVSGKLGLSGKSAAAMTAAIRQNMFQRGIRLPLKISGFGQMIARTFKAFPSRVLFGIWLKAFNIYTAQAQTYVRSGERFTGGYGSEK